MSDGLYHTNDGKVYFGDGKEVTGANNLAQQKSKSHHKGKSHHKSKHHHKSKSAHKSKSKSSHKHK